MKQNILYISSYIEVLIKFLIKYYYEFHFNCPPSSVRIGATLITEPSPTPISNKVEF